MTSLKLKSYKKTNNTSKPFLLIIVLMTLLVAYPIDHPQLQNLPPDSDVIEIVDYKKRIIVGYMVLQNGRIIKKISFATLSNVNKSPTNTQAESHTQVPNQQESSTLPQHYEDEEKLLDAPKNKKSKKIKHKKGFIDGDSIEQQQGKEKQVINKVYRDREWNKRKIPHEITTRVLDIEALR